MCRNREILCISALLLSITAAAMADSKTVAESATQANSADGQYISWKEHIIDDPKIGGEPDLSGSDGLELRDLDGDGFEDIVSVHEADIVYDGKPVGFVRIAWGTDNPDRWELTTLSSGLEAAAAEDVSIADANGDGHPDVVIATELAHLVYLENPGTNARRSNWNRVIPSITTDRGSFIRVFFADFDGDGRPEVVAANKGDQDPPEIISKGNSGQRAATSVRKQIGQKNISLFVLPENPLNGDMWREQVLGKVLMPINSEPVDLDRDGDPDVVAGSRNESRILWFENVGQLEFVEHDIEIAGLPSGVTTSGFNMDYADLDGDGRLDVVVNASSGLLLWLKQPENVDDTWRSHTIGTFSPDDLISVRMADIDGDGDLDAFSGAYSRGPRDADSPDTGVNDSLGRIAWFENPGVNPDEQWTRHDISRRKRGMYDKWLARDLDGDGDIDMVGTRGNSFPYDGVIWLEQVRSNNAQAAFEQAREVDSQQMALPSTAQ